MRLDQVIYEGLLNADFGDLGDRATYVGSSDVAGCPRKVVLDKQQSPAYDLATMIRFARGHLAEELLIGAFEGARVKGWDYQVELAHRNAPFRAHVDFLFKTKKELAVLEVKTVSSIPQSPYEGWVAQLHFQMGLLQDRNPDKTVRGALLAIELNEGEVKIWNNFTYNSEIYEGLLQKASHIWDCLENDVEPQTEKGPLCAWCEYRPGCPAYKNQAEFPQVLLKEELQHYMGLKETQRQIKKELDELTAMLKDAVKNANSDDNTVRIGDYIVKLATRERTSLNSAALRKDHPEIYEQYTRTTSCEVLVVE